MDDHLGTTDGLRHAGASIRKRDMMRDQIGRVASQRQTFGLTLGRSIQKAYLNTRKFSSARGCVELTGRDRISTEQEMFS